MSIEWSASITTLSLREYYDEMTVVRGVRVRRDGRVETAQWDGGNAVLHAQCRGSAHERYSCIVEFDPAGPNWEIVWAECTCPMTTYCKHTVAALLTFAACAQTEGSQAIAAGQPRPTWEAYLDALLREPALEPQRAPLALLADYKASGTSYDPGPTVTLQPATLGRRGTWVRSGITWKSLLTLPADVRFDSRQYAALHNMARTMRTEVYAFLYGNSLPLHNAPQSLWRMLDDARDAGVALVCSSGLTAFEVTDAAVRLDFEREPEGGANIHACLVVDGRPCDEPDGLGLIGQPEPHGVFSVEDGRLTLARFDPAPHPTLLDLFARGRVVRVPATDMDRFTAEALPVLTRRVPVQVPDGVFEPPKVEGPIPVLSVTGDAAAGRAWWSIRYLVNDRAYDYEPSSQVRVDYRDQGAEDTAWKQVADVLALVAGAANSFRDQVQTHAGALLRERMDKEVLGEVTRIATAPSVAEAVEAASIAVLRMPLQFTGVEVARLVKEILPLFEDRQDLIIDSPLDGSQFIAAQAELAFTASDVVGTDWFDLGITVTVAGEAVPIARVFTEIASGATHMLLPSGTYFPLNTPELSRLRELIGEAQALGELESGRVNAGSHNVTLWEELLSLGVVDAQVRAWQSSLQRMSTARPPESVAPPAGLQAELREYQRDGLSWLSFLWDNGFGGILADDMGLGKTLQALALFCRVREQGESGPFLVVAPTSVVTNWASECARFAPDLVGLPVTSTVARGKVAIAELAMGADVVITSYTLLRIDFDHYAAIDWAAVVFDEAQFVKNHNAKVHQCARRLSAPFKLAITGTPMENNLLELWALLSITAPGLFPRPQPFTDYYRRPIESGQDPERLHTLRRRMKPMMLRRTKDQVASDLPPKQEQTLTLDLVAKHRKVYDTRLARERQKVLGLLGDFERNRFEIFRSLTMLRQLSLHAGLVDEADLGIGSAKIDYLTEQLPGLVAEGHSALVFSQFTGFLSLLRDSLDAAGIEYCYLDGSMSSRQRTREIKRFTGGQKQVFLISLKAGGFGLNLTEADYCFLCDPWWNPAAEAQAVDRAHRIGQTRPVNVYRLVSAGTIEEKVVALQERKRKLFNAVIDDGDMFGTAITESDIREMLT